jgi:hypothetical protein
MRTRARLLCAFTLMATPAAAQSTTEDGIRAMLRGEYQAAARILRPLAGAAQPDPVAQFFLAMLYETGRGVGFDSLRACGLFLSASKHAHPFTDQSAAIAAFMREQLGAGASEFCVADERWQGGPPQSFVLGTDHRIVFADTSISLTHGDTEWRTPLRLGVGAEYLPIQYIALDVTRPSVSRRHFFQWWAWTPDTTLNPSSWTLSWMLSEVAGDQWIPITHEKSVAVVNGVRPPASFDPAQVIQVRVNPSGDAEFSITTGAGTRTDIIPARGKQ